jgi:hypothetical protein
MSANWEVVGRGPERLEHVRLGKTVAQLIPRVGVHIYRLGIGTPYTQVFFVFLKH